MSVSSYSNNNIANHIITSNQEAPNSEILKFSTILNGSNSNRNIQPSLVNSGINQQTQSKNDSVRSSSLYSTEQNNYPRTASNYLKRDITLASNLNLGH
jgi:hypothetical protein